MKKRRTALLAFLLTAGVSMGIGFAALSDSFTIYGDLGANVDNSNLVVCFDGEDVNTPEKSTVDGVYCNFATSAGAASIDGKTACELTFQGLDTKGDYATAALRVENRSTLAAANELDATLSTPAISYGTIDQTVFRITAEWADATPEGLVLAPNEANTINVKVELLKTPTASIDASSFEITFTATTA